MDPAASGARGRDDGDIGGIVRSAASLALEDVPERAERHAARVVADTLGVILAGAGKPEVRALARGGGRDERMGPWAGGGPSQVLVPGLPGADAAFAAYVNGTAGTFLELDEGFRPTGHPCVHVLPAALAAGQALRVSGRALLAAVISGYEVVARLFEAYRFTYPLHPHGHFGAVGAAVAVARLRGVDPVEPAAVASTLPLLPVWQSCTEGATARNAYAGTAASMGVMAGRLADAGFRGARGAQRVAFGELVGELVRPERLAEPVDPEDLGICRNYMKFHSACALSHSALDAVLGLASRPEPEQIESVVVETVTNNMKIAVQARPNELSTRFSLPYAVAAALVHGHTGPAAFVPDAEVARLAERVEVRVDGELERSWPEASPALVRVSTRGDELTARVDNPRGHHANPASDADLRQKFLGLVCDVQDGAGRPAKRISEVEALYERLLGIADFEDVSRLFGKAG